LNFSDAVRQAEVLRPPLILVSLVIANDAGRELCRRIRRTRSLARTAVVLLGIGRSDEDCVLGLESGANDYITTPFSSRELVARVQAVLRRFERPQLAEFNGPVTTVGDIKIDSSAMKISVRGNEVTTTTLEFRLMDYLARNQARVFKRDELLDAVWGDMQFVTPRTVDACVRRVRRKIEPDCARPTYLKTIRGVGYHLDAGGPRLWKSRDQYLDDATTRPPVERFEPKSVGAEIKAMSVDDTRRFSD
jgi:two-component system phosphate regulon response regulator PhoB